MRKLHRRPNRFKGQTLGLDLHKKFIQWSLINQPGDEIANERIAASPESLGALVDRLTAGGQGLQVALEACGCFLWVYDLLVEKLGKGQVHVAAPSKVRAIADSREKNDENDAYWLAYFLHDCRLPEAFVAEGDLRALRTANRELRSWTDQRSDLMRRLRSHLAQLGMDLPRGAWTSVAGRAETARRVAQVQTVQGMRGQAIARLWQQIQNLDEEVAYWRDQVEVWSKKFEQVARLDKLIPGVGLVIAATVWSELGDPGRYRSARAYAKATGLTPGYRDTGGRHQGGGKITREGSAHVRWALTRAVVSCQRCQQGWGVAVKHWTDRMSRRKSKKAVYVAAARKLAEGIWRLFALGERFDLALAFGGMPSVGSLADAKARSCRRAGLPPSR